MAKILMTGGTGFVGGAIGRQLTAAGHSVVVVTRNRSRTLGRLSFPCELVEWQAGQRFRLPPEAFQDIDTIIHLAGEPVADKMWTAAQKQRIYDSRIDSTKGLIASIKASGHQPKAFIQASAVGFYGNGGDQILGEDRPPRDDFLGKTCADWEQVGRESETLGMRHVAIRVGLVLGHEGGALPQLVSVYAMGLGANLAGGQHYVPWIHLEDVAGLFVTAALDESWSGIYNGTAPSPVRFWEFHNALGEHLKVPHFLGAPGFALRLLLGGRAAIVLNSQRTSAEKVLKTGFTFRYGTLNSAMEVLFGSRQLPGVRYTKLQQWLPQSRAEVWPFFCDAMNLERLTPPYLNFKVLGKSTDDIRKGTLIDYRLSLHGIPLKWRTEIVDWQEQVRFVDKQIKGPYALWHHTHTFEDLAGGTLMTDVVQYKLPMGLLGSVAGGKYVEWDVGRIFRYRLDQGAAIFAGA